MTPPIPPNTNTTNGTSYNRSVPIEELIYNATSLRKEMFMRLMDPRRNLEDECGYPRIDTLIDAQYYRQLYDRDPIANRVVQLMPKECWAVQPKVYEDEDADTKTPFEEALYDGPSWFGEEQGSSIWPELERADIQAGIGHFGIILLGIDDGLDLSQPVDGSTIVMNRQQYTENPIQNWEIDYLRSLKNLNEAEQLVINRLDNERNTIHNSNSSPTFSPASSSNDGNIVSTWQNPQPSGTDQQYFGVQFGPSQVLADTPAKTKHNLVFINSFDESLVQIVRWEWSVRNPRFGKPVMYRVTLNDPRVQHSGVGLPMATVFVHWSRVIHIADNKGSSKVMGVPRMRPILNAILDHRKVRGAGAEGYWKAAFTGLQFSTHPQLGGDVDVNRQEIMDTAENYQNSLQRFLIAAGGQWSTLAPSVTDPTPHIAAATEAICVQLGCPVRVFKGAERGELASSQDDADWNGRVSGVQWKHCTADIIIPFIDRLILFGILPEPKANKNDDYATTNKIVTRRKTVKRLVYNADTGETKEQTSTYLSKVLKTKGGYIIEWPDLDSLTDMDQAKICQMKVASLSQFIQGNGESMVSPMDYYTKYEGRTEEEAEAIVQAAQDHQDELQEKAAEQADEFGVEVDPHNPTQTRDTPLEYPEVDENGEQIDSSKQPQS
jgi:Anti-CBASS Acb1-like protein